MKPGLKGVYDLDLEWTPEPSEAFPIPPNTSIIFTAVQRQLALKLEARKDAVEVWSFDRADQVPVAN